jgi:hypothetical protein
VRYCKDCDKSYPDDKKFCSDCGKQLTELIEKPVEETKVPTQHEVIVPWKKVLLVAIAIGAVILIGNLTGMFSLPGGVVLTTTTTIPVTTTVQRVTTTETVIPPTEAIVPTTTVTTTTTISTTTTIQETTSTTVPTTTESTTTTTTISTTTTTVQTQYQSCIRGIFDEECRKYNLIYTDYSSVVGFITCTDDGAYTWEDIGDESKYLQVYAPTRTLEIKCGTYQEPTGKEKCMEDYFGELCQAEGLIYTDYSRAVGFITCTDDGIYIFGDISDSSKYKQVYVSQGAIDSRCPQ